MAVDLSWADSFLASIRPYVFVREEDSLLILIPNQAYQLNRSAARILAAGLSGRPMSSVLAPIADSPDKLEQVHHFLCDLAGLLKGHVCEAPHHPGIEVVPYRGSFNALPVLSEVAVTYRCNLACSFCYASCNCTSRLGQREMTTGEVRKVLRVIRHDALVPSVSLTGGEPALRKDLPALVAYARGLGLWTNLITNGSLVDRRVATRLARAGLNSAQVSLEGPTAEIHDSLTRNPGSFQKTVAGIAHLRQAKIPVHTNTTLNALNAPHAEDLVDLVAELGLSRFSMNLLIPCGSAKEIGRDLWLSYSEVGEVILKVRGRARDRGILFLWYSPTPYCLFNPIAHGLGNKACAACDGLLSVSPTGDVLPCSSLSEPVGNLLSEPFEEVWNSPRARYYREKRFAPPACRSCPRLRLCAGACPLYWQAVGDAEIQRTAKPYAQAVAS